jgi:hypothetical protein
MTRLEAAQALKERIDGLCRDIDRFKAEKDDGE